MVGKWPGAWHGGWWTTECWCQAEGASPPLPFLHIVDLGLGFKEAYLLTLTDWFTRVRRLIPRGSPATTAAFSQNPGFPHSVGTPSQYLCPKAAQSLIFQVPTHVFIPLDYGES